MKFFFFFFYIQKTKNKNKCLEKYTLSCFTLREPSEYNQNMNFHYCKIVVSCNAENRFMRLTATIINVPNPGKSKKRQSRKKEKNNNKGG